MGSVRTVEVCVDDAPARLGTLSYLVPSALGGVEAGVAVKVPFGTGDRFGMVVGTGDSSKATKSISDVLGSRAHSGDVAAAVTLSARHLCGPASVFARFAPSSHKGADPIDAGLVALKAGTDDLEVRGPKSRVRTVAVSPNVPLATAAAQRAAALAETGQVLVLCPTVDLVKNVLACFESGAGRLDAKAERGMWKGFVEGTVTIGVATRAGAWFSPKNLSGIVVVDADHPGHKAAALPYLHSRDVAVERAAGRDVPVELLVDVPSALSLASAKLWEAGPEAPNVNVRQREGGRVPNDVKVAAGRAAKSGGSVIIVVPDLQAARRCTQCRAACGCEPSACLHSVCSACGGKVVTFGWTLERVRKTFGPAAQMRRLSEVRAEPSANHDLAVFVNADAALRSPSLEPERAMFNAVHAVRRSARVVWALVDDVTSPTASALASPGSRPTASVVWQAAKHRGLPPFGVLVELEFVSSKKPSLRFPGRVIGPQPGSKQNSWRAMVVCAEDQLDAVGAGLDDLRAAGAKVRFTVTATPSA